MESEIHKLILSRAPISRAKGEKIQFTNFVEVGGLLFPLLPYHYVLSP